MNTNKQKFERELNTQKNKLEEMAKIVENLQLKYNEDFSVECKLISNHKNFIANPYLEIAIVGAIKAGKSTLINALLNEKIASTEVTPETATLTKFKYSEKNYLKITFYTQKEWNLLWGDICGSDNRNEVFKTEYNNLGAQEVLQDYINKEPIFEYSDNLEELRIMVKKYTSSKSKTHYFVKELEIGLNNSNLPKEVCFVDTPGLNDVVPYRSNITKEYIKRANAVIVCINADSMRNDEYTTIVKVFENVGGLREKVFILGTQIDKLNNPESDWKKQKKEWSKYLLSVFKNEELLENNILGTTSYIYHVINDLKNKKECNEHELLDLINFTKKTDLDIIQTGSRFNKIMSLLSNEKTKLISNSKIIIEKTNIENFKFIMNGRLLDNSSKILLEDFIFRYSHLKKSISNRLSRIIERNNDSINILNMEVNDLKKLEEEKEKNRIEILNISKEIIEDFLVLKNNINENLKKTGQELENEIKKNGIGG